MAVRTQVLCPLSRCAAAGINHSFLRRRQRRTGGRIEFLGVHLVEQVVHQVAWPFAFLELTEALVKGVGQRGSLNVDDEVATVVLFEVGSVGTIGSKEIVDAIANLVLRRVLGVDVDGGAADDALHDVGSLAVLRSDLIAQNELPIPSPSVKAAQKLRV